MTWGDAFFAVVAYCVIVGMIWLYGKDRGALSEFKDNFRKFVVFCFFTTIILTVTKKSPAWFTTLMGLIPMPMVVAGRVPQIIVCFQNKSAGQLSFYSLLMQCAGNFARIISTLALVSDRIVLCSHLTAFIFNAAPLLQLIYYNGLHGDLRNIKPLASTCQRQIVDQLACFLRRATPCIKSSPGTCPIAAACKERSLDETLKMSSLISSAAETNQTPVMKNQMPVAAAENLSASEFQALQRDLPKKRFARI